MLLQLGKTTEVLGYNVYYKFYYLVQAWKELNKA